MRLFTPFASFLTSTGTASGSPGEERCCFAAIGTHYSSIRGIRNSLTMHARTLVGSSGNSPAPFCGCSTLVSRFRYPTRSSPWFAWDSFVPRTGILLVPVFKSGGGSLVGSGNGLAGGEGGCTTSARNRSSSPTFKAIAFAIGCPLHTTCVDLSVLTTLWFNEVVGPHYCTPAPSPLPFRCRYHTLPLNGSGLIPLAGLGAVHVPLD